MMNNCFNPIILSFMSIFIQFCLSNKAIFMTDLEYVRMSAEGRKIYLKKAFDKAFSTLHSLLEHEMLPYFKNLADEGSITEDQKATYRKAQEAFEVAEVVQAGIDRQEYAKQKRFSEAPIKMMSCFLHNDPNPSMNYVTSDTQQGFHCFGCMESEKVIDVFGLINLYSQWQGKGSLPFTNQLVLAEQLFVNGDVSNVILLRLS